MEPLCHGIFKDLNEQKSVTFTGLEKTNEIYRMELFFKSEISPLKLIATIFFFALQVSYVPLSRRFYRRLRPCVPLNQFVILVIPHFDGIESCYGLYKSFGKIMIKLIKTCYKQKFEVRTLYLNSRVKITRFVMKLTRRKFIRRRLSYTISL